MYSYKKGLYDSQYGPPPSMHGVLRLILSLDGEDVIDCEPILGVAEYQKLITRNPIFLQRVEGIGIVSAEEAINWGLSGQCYELPEYDGIFVKLIIMSVMTNLIGESSGKRKGIR
uniref:NADH-quinone oxidoreductase subunit D domain-containing protein n=1 Tax=Salix viminalis TaxID=40686 RepID=A0A6N2KDR4_SALVM